MRNCRPQFIVYIRYVYPLTIMSGERSTTFPDFMCCECITLHGMVWHCSECGSLGRYKTIFDLLIICLVAFRCILRERESAHMECSAMHINWIINIKYHIIVFFPILKHCNTIPLQHINALLI